MQLTDRFTDTGTGTGTSDPPLVLLHAFPVDSRMWDGVLAPLSAVTRVIVPDLRGFGRSASDREVDPAEVEPSMARLAGDVLALLDRLELERVVLAGCSMGGYTAMALLAAAPQRLAGLVLVDTRPDADDFDKRAGRLAMATRAEREGTAWLVETVLPSLIAAGTPDGPSSLVNLLPMLIADQSATAVAWAQRAMAARADSTDVLRGFTGPALVIVGERDVLCPPEVARDMAGLLRSAELVEIPGAGHLTPMEAPGEVAAAIRDWLGNTANTANTTPS